jgi:hypothetical protein
MKHSPYTVPVATSEHHLTDLSVDRALRKVPVDLLVCSLPLHRHSYIGFILAFASSIHNKQQRLQNMVLQLHI